jgi:hypothetical protein
LALGLERGIGFVTGVPRPCAVRQELAAWGGQPPAVPRLLETPGRTQAEAPRRWPGPSVLRQVEVEDKEGRRAQETLRCGGVHARQLAQQPTHAESAAQAQEAAALTGHIQQGPARWCACQAAAVAALAEDAHRGPGQRGWRPQVWRYPAVRARVVAATRPTRRARRGRPGKTAPPPRAAGSHVVVAVAALATHEEDHGWPVLATTVSPAVRMDPEILQA